MQLSIMVVYDILKINRIFIDYTEIIKKLNIFNANLSAINQ